MNNNPTDRWITIEEAVGVVQMQTAIDKAGPMLEAAVVRGVIRCRGPKIVPDDGVVGPVRTVPGGLNFYRGIPNRDIHGTRVINLADLHEWIASLKNGFDQQPLRSGAAGRPSSMKLVMEEHARRRANGTTAPSRQKEAEDLAEWLEHTHPKHPPATAGTISNNLPNDFRPTITK